MSAAVPQPKPGTKRPLRGILVGCGYISTSQLDAWAAIPDAEIVALVDTDERQARLQAEAYGIAAAHTDLAGALAEHRVDFVDVATPPESHLDVVLLAVSAGCHVLCQKPLAPTLGQIDLMIDAADRAGVQLVANENMRFQAWFVKMKEILDSGRLGRPFYSHWSNRSRATLPMVNFGSQPYFASMPRLVIYEIGVHYFDTMRYLFGDPQHLSASIGHASTEIAGEDNAVALVSYDNSVAIMDISWASIPTYVEADAVSWGVMTVECEGGTMHLAADGRLRILSDDGEERLEFGPSTIAASFVAMQRRFIECVARGLECETSARQYAKTMELAFGAYFAGASHQVYRVGRDRHRLL